ncbi:hypothetical protein PVAP13_3NG018900 [Panicum virgatum]|uniref:Uncharacterized protein n=1 Tax=Panicum virgatum TaxID=38727 RepID=A0A8T0TXW8_PANVG|nr:hypothetical protein PVAP13_3NG018900 [Panicum virgatum]
MAIPVARVHLAMAHAALPGLLPSPSKCMMVMPPLLPTPPCAIVLPSSSPPNPSRADAAQRWDAHKIKPAGSPTSSSSSSCGRRFFDGESISSPGRASSCERWDSNKKKNAAAASSSASRTSSPGRSSSSSRADSEERWDAHKKPTSLTSWSSSARSNTKGERSKRRASSSRASSTAARWDTRKKPTARLTDELNDGEGSTGSNDMEYLGRPLPQQALYAGPGFLSSPDPSMLPMPSLMIRVAKRCSTRGALLAVC